MFRLREENVSGQLINIPYGEDAQSWYMKTAIYIHGVTYDHPDFCTKERHVCLILRRL